MRAKALAAFALLITRKGGAGSIVNGGASRSF